jgi:HD-GYP domain-containing protein (c-di-GMP phosphodiesterase class II)
MGAHFTLREVSVDDGDAGFDRLLEGYLHVKTRNLIPRTLLPFDVYFPALVGYPKELKLEKLVSAEEMYQQELHDRLMSEDIDGVYIESGKDELLFEYTSRNVQDLIHSSDASIEQKTQILYDYAEMIVRKVFKERPSRSSIIIGREFVGTFAEHLSADEMSTKVLLSLFSRDYYTFTHSVQVALLGITFCRFLGWKSEQVMDFGLGALFHDIGKNSIDERILNKPSKLERDEFEIIKKHPLFGYNQLKKAQTMSREQLLIALHHHEAMDGSGYPCGLKGEAIHKFARVACLVDCFDALTTKRVYKDALPWGEALRIMKDEMGYVFDSAYLDDFIHFMQTDCEVESVISNRIGVELGSQMVLQFEDTAIRSKAVLVGMEIGRYLIVRVPGLDLMQSLLGKDNGPKVIVRYLLSGVAYGFRSKVLHYTLTPAKLLFLAYPRRVEKLNLRKNPRLEVDIPVQAEIRGEVYTGRILDISAEGCRVALAGQGPSIGSDFVDEEVTLSMQLAAQGLENLPCKVRNVNTSSHELTLGMQFTPLNEALENALKLLLDLSARRREGG